MQRLWAQELQAVYLSHLEAVFMGGDRIEQGGLSGAEIKVITLTGRRSAAETELEKAEAGEEPEPTTLKMVLILAGCLAGGPDPGSQAGLTAPWAGQPLPGVCGAGSPPARSRTAASRGLQPSNAHGDRLLG
jgi:hypothetical protein